jgi:hypothetical protein
MRFAKPKERIGAALSSVLGDGRPTSILEGRSRCGSVVINVLVMRPSSLSSVRLLRAGSHDLANTC